MLDLLKNGLPNQTAVLDDDGVMLSYAQFRLACDNFSLYLKDRELAFCLCSNSIGSLLGYVSFLRKGVVVLLLDEAMCRETLLELLNIYKPGLIWLPDKNGENYGLKIYTAYGYSLFKTDNPAQSLHKDLALLLTTSGSTGSAKMVRISYNNIAANTESIVEFLKINQKDRAITSLPMHYAYGLSVIHTHLMSGATLLMTQQSVIRPGFWEFAQKESASSIACVPHTVEILSRTGFFDLNIPSLKVVTQAGGKLREELASEFAGLCRKNGIRFYIMYGQTEATARISYLPTEQSEVRPGSIGKAIPGGSISILDDKSKLVTVPEVVGELCYQGPNVSMGYATGCDDLDKGDENNGFLRTGDLAFFDVDGYYYIAGRKNRYIKLFGHRISLDEIETMVQSIDADCAVVEKENVVHIFLTKQSSTKEVKDKVLIKTGISPVSLCLHVVDKISRTSGGKVSYGEMERQLFQ